MELFGYRFFESDQDVLAEPTVEKLTEKKYAAHERTDFNKDKLPAFLTEKAGFPKGAFVVGGFDALAGKQAPLERWIKSEASASWVRVEVARTSSGYRLERFTAYLTESDDAAYRASF